MIDSQARLVIIGAGIVGCSAAYHLTKMGIHDVVVLEQGPLFEAGGSTSHAPGIIFETNFSRVMTKFSQYTIDFLSGLTLDGAPCFHQVGSMEVAYTRERQEDLKRKLGVARSWGVKGELISPEEAREKIPLLDAGKIYGAYYVPADGITKQVRACEAMAREAISRGARFHGRTEVVGMEVTGGKIRAVNTSQGQVRTENVLICAGIWGPKVGRMAGVHIPLKPMEHQYATTETVPELRGETREIVHPALRHQDRAMYFRQYGDAYAIGSYLHEPVLVEPDEILPHDRAAVMPSMGEFRPEIFERARREADDLLPSLRGLRLVRKVNGIFSFTPDGMPLMGQSREVEGVWVAEAVWITHSCGVARTIAEWIVDGETSLDLRECDINRFHDYALSDEYVRERALQQYREVYDIIHPLQQMNRPRNLRFTPFHRRQEELGAVFFETAGWEKPQWYGSNAGLVTEKGDRISKRSGWEARYWSPIQGAEHLATREGAAAFDMSTFAKFAVEGRGALEYLQRLSANQIDKPVGRVTYTTMLTRKGGIVCDLTITRLGESSFLVITGGATEMHDLSWMRGQLPNDGSATITDVSSSYCCLGLWGPRAREVLAGLAEESLSFPSFSMRRVMLGAIPVMLSSVSYAGEDGWEIYAKTEHGAPLWDAVFGAGRGEGIVAAGMGALDSLRLEKGYRLWGADIHTEYNPYEAGLERGVKLEKGEFTGREALIGVKERGVTRKLCRMHFDEPGRVVMGKEPILRDGRVLGYVTSSNYGYTAGKGIAFGYLPVDDAKEGTPVEVHYFGVRHPATVVSEK